MEIIGRLQTNNQMCQSLEYTEVEEILKFNNLNRLLITISKLPQQN